MGEVAGTETGTGHLVVLSGLNRLILACGFFMPRFLYLDRWLNIEPD